LRNAGQTDDVKGALADGGVCTKQVGSCKYWFGRGLSRGRSTYVLGLESVSNF